MTWGRLRYSKLSPSSPLYPPSFTPTTAEQAHIPCTPRATESECQRVEGGVERSSGPHALSQRSALLAATAHNDSLPRLSQSIFLLMYESGRCRFSAVSGKSPVSMWKFANLCGECTNVCRVCRIQIYTHAYAYTLKQKHTQTKTRMHFTGVYSFMLDTYIHTHTHKNINIYTQKHACTLQDFIHLRSTIILQFIRTVLGVPELLEMKGCFSTQNLETSDWGFTLSTQQDHLPLRVYFSKDITLTPRTGCCKY